jgi:hypothetical protein
MMFCRASNGSLTPISSATAGISCISPIAPTVTREGIEPRFHPDDRSNERGFEVVFRSPLRE